MKNSLQKLIYFKGLTLGLFFVFTSFSWAARDIHWKSSLLGQHAQVAGLFQQEANKAPLHEQENLHKQAALHATLALADSSVTFSWASKIIISTLSQLEPENESYVDIKLYRSYSMLFQEDQPFIKASNEFNNTWNENQFEAKSKALSFWVACQIAKQKNTHLVHPPKHKSWCLALKTLFPNSVFSQQMPQDKVVSLALDIQSPAQKQNITSKIVSPTQSWAPLQNSSSSQKKPSSATPKKQNVNWLIQLGAFGSLSNATKQLRKVNGSIRKTKRKAQIIPIKNGKLNAIRILDFSSEAEAQEFSKKISSKIKFAIINTTK